MRTRTRSRLASAVAVAVLALVTLYASPAQAANPYTAAQVCGSSYTYKVASRDLGGKAVLHLRYSPSLARLCATTIKTTKIGTPSSTEAWVKVIGQPWVSNKGNYSYYAGPVYINLNKECPQYAGGHDGTNWTSPLLDCKRDLAMSSSITGASATCSTYTSPKYEASRAYYVHYSCNIKDTSADWLSPYVQYYVASTHVYSSASNTQGAGTTVNVKWIGRPYDTSVASWFGWRVVTAIRSGPWVTYTR